MKDFHVLKSGRSILKMDQKDRKINIDIEFLAIPRKRTTEVVVSNGKNFLLYFKLFESKWLEPSGVFKREPLLYLFDHFMLHGSLDSCDLKFETKIGDK